MNSMELAEAVGRIKWFHTIDLGHGVVTPGQDRSRQKLPGMCIPESLAGKTVLDIGSADGFFSFEAERRGASRVLATDIFAWRDAPTGQQGFNLVRRVLNSKVEDQLIDVMDISPERVGTFDVVMFPGVLYHLKHPLLALENIYSVTKEMLILETAVDLLGISRPASAFYPGSELNQDHTNWFGPNPACIEAMLKTVGFRRVRKMTPAWVHSVPYRFAYAFRRRFTRQTPWLQAFQQGRCVYHAWK